MQISKLPKANTVNDDDLAVIVQNCETKSIKRKDFVGAQPDSLSLNDNVLQLTAKGEKVGDAVSLLSHCKQTKIIIPRIENGDKPQNPTLEEGDLGVQQAYVITRLDENGNALPSNKFNALNEFGESVALAGYPTFTIPPGASATNYREGTCFLVDTDYETGKRFMAFYGDGFDVSVENNKRYRIIANLSTNTCNKPSELKINVDCSNITLPSLEQNQFDYYTETLSNSKLFDYQLENAYEATVILKIDFEIKGNILSGEVSMNAKGFSIVNSDLNVFPFSKTSKFFVQAYSLNNTDGDNTEFVQEGSNKKITFGLSVSRTKKFSPIFFMSKIYVQEWDI